MKDSQRVSDRQWIDLGISSTVSVESTSSPARRKTEPSQHSDGFALYSPSMSDDITKHLRLARRISAGFADT